MYHIFVFLSNLTPVALIVHVSQPRGRDLSRTLNSLTKMRPCYCSVTQLTSPHYG